MKVRIGVADSSKLIELDVDDLKTFKKTLAEALKSGDMAWFTDSKNREIGVPAVRISYVEIEAADAEHHVGFGPGG